MTLPRPEWCMLAGTSLHCLLDLRLDGFQIEACTLLHRREVKRSLGKLCHPLLRNAKLDGEPVVEGH